MAIDTGQTYKKAKEKPRIRVCRKPYFGPKKEKPLSLKRIQSCFIDEEVIPTKDVKEAVERLKEYMDWLDRFDRNKIQTKIDEIFGEFK